MQVCWNDNPELTKKDISIWYNFTKRIDYFFIRAVKLFFSFIIFAILNIFSIHVNIYISPSLINQWENKQVNKNNWLYL